MSRKAVKKAQLRQREVQDAPAAVAHARARWATLAAVAALVLLGAILRVSVADEGVAQGPDEKFYNYHANVTAHEGIAGVRKMVLEHERVTTSWIYPPPSRVGYLWIRAAAIKLTNSRDGREGVHVSILFSVLTLGLIALAGLRYFNSWITILALALACASFPELVMVRRGW